ncbi:MAG: AzlC family ABC transporter permease [Clostridia bacterium]|nr:AzlC family ABC transporter permease [Clostridia bacterium]
MKKRDFFKGMLHGVPICLGYLAVSFSFGIFAVAQGLSILETVMISLFNMTSAGQLAGVPIIACGGSLLELASTQLFINLRYALMSVSLSQRLDGRVRLLDRVLIGFGVTDEVFAVSVSQPTEVSKQYMAGLILVPYLGWGGGTLLGAVAGNILPSIVTTALGVAIYGMLIAIVVPPMRDHRPTALCVLLAVALSCAFRYLPFLSKVSDGFVIIICAVAASALLAVLRPVSQETES